MSSNPTAGELVRAVRLFIRETARPALSGHAAFHARVAENALAIVERELEQAAGAEARGVRRLRALLDQEDGDFDTLTRTLCERIRGGEMDWTDQDLMAHLRQATIDQVRIDQPRYSGLAIATESD